MVAQTPSKGGARTARTPPGPRRIDPTPQEAYFFLYILKHCRNKPDVDWDAVAEEANFKNGATANARFRQIKQKLGFHTPSTPKKAKNSGEASGLKTPRSGVTKKAATPRKPKGKKIVDRADDAERGDDDEDPKRETARLVKVQRPDEMENTASRIKDEEDDEDQQPPFSSSMFADVKCPDLASQYPV
ncbi:hypothetical protein GGTG_11234 [Gaeumannomyces tritici R3-111a-1]|uniref:Myb-like DNA-binding domain-containing protein n=1 Tax=Gaeumannomyces tritici (strain R3-111a-1) TaxID=644352 RepID=J3PCL4_GAET3|nr:hypothetical protein GGTG_11234 [Gaeumannomyces tritici R3-111a-1]EJT71984.1 hypothetical protein GGTG_11234 [Gaeumannomyces tritici R3-111a-1]